MITLLILSISSASHASQGSENVVEILPPKDLYDAPIADPRWPKFLIGLSHDFNGNLGKSLWTFNFGEDIGLIKFGNPKCPYQFGVQAGAFGIMDISSKPTRLLNTDYLVALYISHAHNNFQHLWQINHQSSHVGDEFLLSQAQQSFNRIDLNCNMIKYSLRYKPSRYFSPYISAGYIFNAYPNNIKRLALSAGIDLYSKKIVFKDSTRLILGAFVNSWEENDYKPTAVIRAGLQYERLKYCDRFLQLLVEYTVGKSQQGQFYNTNIQQLGILIAFSS